MLDKAIEHGREHRKQYAGRNHSSCGWCQDNRHRRNVKRKLALEEAEKEFRENDWEV